MTLNEYLSGLPSGGQAAFAKQIGISPAYLSQISTGFRSAGIEIAALIERESSGVVTAQEVRPDVDWAVIRGTRDPAAEPAP